MQQKLPPTKAIPPKSEGLSFEFEQDGIIFIRGKRGKAQERLKIISELKKYGEDRNYAHVPLLALHNGISGFLETSAGFDNLIRRNCGQVDKETSALYDSLTRRLQESTKALDALEKDPSFSNDLGKQDLQSELREAILNLSSSAPRDYNLSIKYARDAFKLLHELER